MVNQNASQSKSNNSNIHQSTIVEAYDKASRALDALSIDFDLLSGVIDSMFQALSNPEITQEGDKTDEQLISEMTRLKRDVEKKNELNRLSIETYNLAIKQNVDEYFKIRKFLQMEGNEEYRRKYQLVRMILTPCVINALNQGATMDAIFAELLQRVVSSTKASHDELKYSEYYYGIFYYMYYICDLGKNPNEAVDS